MDGEEMSMCSSPTFAMASSEFHPAISPIEWKRRRSGSSSSGVDHGDGGGTVVEDGASSGMSGLLSFLGDSPAFDRTAAPSDEEGGGGDEVERNLRRSAEKVERLEEHLLRCAGAAGPSGAVFDGPCAPLAFVACFEQAPPHFENSFGQRSGQG